MTINGREESERQAAASERSLEEVLEKLVEAETQLDNLISTMSFGFFLYEVVPDSTGKDNIRVLIINQKMADLIRTDKEKSVGKFFQDIWPGQKYQLYLNLALGVAATGISATCEPYDDDLGVYLNVTMYRPKIGQVAVIASDRSEMVQAEVNLQKAYSDINTILNEIPAPICIVKKDNGCILSNNLAFMNLCGHSELDAVKGKYIQDYLVPETANLSGALKTYFSETEDFVCDLARADGEKIQVKVFSRLLKFQNEEAYASHFVNLTKQRSDEKALREAARIAEEASELKSRFLANMSHEIRTPMNGVVGFAELALHDKSNSPEVRDYLRKIKSCGESLLGIINDILDITKIESGKMEIESIPFDLHDVFRQCESICSIKAAEKGVGLYFYAEPFIGRHLIGDPAKLQQVLLNLLSNAIKFTAQGMVKLLAKIENEEDDHLSILFEVKDTGIGMTPEQLKKIFKPFAQADASTTRQYGGTGLGLSISKSIVEMMGGELLVSSAEGKGSTFSFSLVFETGNILEQEQKSGVFMDNTKPPKFCASVLVCEDNEINREIIQAHLSLVGLNPVIVSNGKLGLDEARQKMAEGKPFDLIFMDIYMPVMDGMQSAKLMRESGVETPIVALTANVLTNDSELYLNSGMDDYLAKPFLEIDLWNCLYRHLEAVE